MFRAPLENVEVSVDELNRGMAEAAEAGHEDIVRLMLSQGANAYNTGLTSAAAGGHESIVRLMLDQGLPTITMQWQWQPLVVRFIL